MSRAALVATVGLLLGGAGLALSLKHLARSVRFRMQRGRPYIPGSIRRAAFSTLIFSVLFVTGAAVGTALWLLRDLQAVDGLTRAARLRVVDSGSGLLLELQPDRRHPDQPVLAAGLPGEFWEVSGTFIAFPVWTRPLGLDAAHRLRRAGDPGGPEPSLPPGVARAARVLRGLPSALGIQVQRRSLGGRGTLPRWTAVMASRDGYHLAPDDENGAAR